MRNSTMEVTPISPMWPQQFSNRVEYDTRTVKVTTKVATDHQTETVYTYDKYGRLINTVVRKDSIAEI